MNFESTHRLLRVTPVVMVLAMGATCALSQPVYRSVDNQGRVTFSDRALSQTSTVWGSPGLAAVETSNATAPVSAAPSAAAASNLPPALQPIVSRYPVSLLTSQDCAGCGHGRSLLTLRGVPFTETVVSTAADMELLQNLTGKLTPPVLTVGSLTVKDFSAAEWHGFLDAAGYPKASILPTSYKNPPPVPWLAPRVARVEVPPAAVPAIRPPPMEPGEPAPRLVPLAPSNSPLGVKF